MLEYIGVQGFILNTWEIFVARMQKQNIQLLLTWCEEVTKSSDSKCTKWRWWEAEVRRTWSKMWMLACRRAYVEKLWQNVAKGGVWSWGVGSGSRVEKYGWWGILWLPFIDKYLRHCVTSRKVAGSIPDGVITISHWHNPSGRTMVLSLTQPLTEMSTRNISWRVKAAGA